MVRETKASREAAAKAADAVAAGAIEGAGAVAREGGDADQTVAGAIGGAAAAAGEATDPTPSGAVPAAGDAEPALDPSPTPEPVPPAPGDDATSAFDRKLARLERLVDDAEFETGTAFGDLRDTILDLFKHRPKLWSAMSKGEQQDAIRAVEAAAKRIIGKVVIVVAEDESDTIQATFLGNFNVKSEAIEAKLKIDGVDADVLSAVYKLSGHRVVIVSADDKRFMSARKAPEVDEDQLGMTFGGDARRSTGNAIETKPPAQPGPEGDDDLVDAANDPAKDDDGDDGDPETDVERQATAGDDRRFGLFDTNDKEWLKTAPNGEGGDKWTAFVAEALVLAHYEATRLAGEFGDGFEVRLLS
jgi:hypothetical protein